MITRQDIIGEINRLSGFKDLIEVYEEIAAERMKKIRNSVLKARDFLAGLTEIFKEVQTEYKNEVLMLMEKKRIKDKSKMSIIQNNGKTICVLISANEGLYGDIVKKTFYLFLDSVKKQKTDVAIIGRAGRAYFEEIYPQKQFDYFDFPDNLVDLESLKKVCDHLVKYEKVLVFHGQFQNVVNQIPNISNISDDRMENKTLEKKAVKFFFEPSLEKILTFFETEIFASIFEQTVHESQLAKFACRMVSLDFAIENIKKGLEKVEYQKRVIGHREMNKKQLETFSGARLWR